MEFGMNPAKHDAQLGLVDLERCGVHGEHVEGGDHQGARIRLVQNALLEDADIAEVEVVKLDRMTDRSVHIASAVEHALAH